jgi:hypothetical protein
MTTKQLATALADVYRGYQNDLVDPAVARRELGVDDLALLRASRDPILLALATGVSVQRQQWEASFAEAALLLAGRGARGAGRVRTNDSALRIPRPAPLAPTAPVPFIPSE